MAAIHVSSKAPLPQHTVENIKQFSMHQRVGVNFANENITHADPLCLGEYFEAREILHHALAPDASKRNGPFGDLVSRIQAVANRQFKGSDMTLAQELKRRVDSYLDIGASVHIAYPKAARLLELAGMETWADGFRLLVVNQKTGDVSVEFFAPKYEDAEGGKKIIKEVVHRLEFLGDFTALDSALSLTSITEKPIIVPKEAPLSFRLGKEYFDAKGDLSINPHFMDGEFITVYHGSMPLKVHHSLCVDERLTFKPDSTTISGAKPAVLAGFDAEKPARVKLQEVIAERRAVAVSGSAMSLAAANDPNDYGAFTNKSHIANSKGVARSLMALYRARFEATEEETVYMTGSMAYHNVLPSFDVLVAREFHKLLDAYIEQRQQLGQSAPKHRDAFVNISDRNSRARDGKGWQMPGRTGIDFVTNVESDDISNNAKEMLMLGVAEQLVVLGGGPTVCRNLVRAKLMGLDVISCAFSNSVVGVSGATHAIGDFAKIQHEIMQELIKEKSKGPQSFLPEHKQPAIGPTGFNIHVVGSQTAAKTQPEIREEMVDLADPATAKIPRYGLAYSAFSHEGDAPDAIEEKVASFVESCLNPVLLKTCLSM